ncbi:hypothetical protein [Lutibacter sp.]|uniref:hypothetical protein n=1 Tax=Lutibacter sp. TaxID=1925666 RepID=UPI001A2CC317|nr:hypothetical protein [Lutibacter sp.]MBI9042820.1 hypothetical protein [Lutibacter sp.]
MSIFDFFKSKDSGDKNNRNVGNNSAVDKLIECTTLTSNELLSLIKIKKEREVELYLFSQWVTMNSAIINEVDPSIMDNYYLNHDVKWIMQRNLPMDYGPKLSQVRVHRFNEYNEFTPVLQSLFGGNYDGSMTMKFSRIVFTNCLGDEAFNYLLTSGPMLPLKLQEVMLKHGVIIG